MKRIIAVVITVLVAGVCFGQQHLVVPPFQDKKTGLPVNQVETLTDLFINAVQRTNRFQVPDRDSLALLTNEAKFQMNDWSDDKKTIEMGRVLNANYIVRGIVSELDPGVYLLLVRLLDVKTAQILDSDELEFTSVRSARTQMDTFAQDCLNNIRTASEMEEGPRIGDRGPAGGFIFYDKGEVTNGWRYLEAAPVETESQAAFGLFSIDVINGIGVAVGTGKQNTQILVEQLRRNNESEKAAQICDRLHFGGFDDWFLPSKDELNLMYTNLGAKGLGNFRKAWYWSSSHINSVNAWDQDFRDGKQGYDRKNYTYTVRAVRSY